MTIQGSICKDFGDLISRGRSVMPRRACDSTVKQTKCNLSILKGASRCWAFLSSIWIEAKCEISQAFLTFFAQKINEMIQKIKDFFSPLTAQEQEERYLKLNGYPKETVTFSDRNGRLTKLIG